ncbi:unnamed protein product, partial [Discosporangium mesarthrocarpum]
LREIFDEGETSAGLACEELIDMCLERGSRDNMSAVVVVFEGCHVPSTGEGVQGRRNKRQPD